MAHANIREAGPETSMRETPHHFPSAKEKKYFPEKNREKSDGERHGVGGEGVPAVQGEVLAVGKHAAVLPVPPVLLRLPPPRRPEEELRAQGGRPSVRRQVLRLLRRRGPRRRRLRHRIPPLLRRPRVTSQPAVEYACLLACLFLSSQADAVFCHSICTVSRANTHLNCVYKSNQGSE